MRIVVFFDLPVVTAKEKKAAAKKSAPAKKSGNAEFKRRYFDYYDDIKISDRQDW